LSPIDEEEIPKEGARLGNEWSSKAVVLLRSPQPNAIVPYETASDAVDRNLRRIMYHCE
jgi:hypothetical protein